MSEKMYKYELAQPFQNKNSGFSRWTYGRSEGKDYFLKEFLNPVYPDDSSLSLKLRKERILDCEEYETEKKRVYEAINRASDGNLVRIHEFFRYDSHYYIATDKIPESGISVENLKAFPLATRFLLCKCVAHSIMNLHKEHIVHSDIKANNILIKKTMGNRLVGKIIDFDSSFFESKPPATEDELVADQVYMSPEACLFICGDEVELTCKMDVFALGILFHQYLTGEFPEFDRNEYDYIADAVLDEQPVVLSSELTPYYKSLIQGMLECNPQKRFSMEKVYWILKKLDPNERVVEEAEPEPEVKPVSQSEPDEFGFMQAGDL